MWLEPDPVFIHEESVINAHPIELRRRIFNYNLSHSLRNAETTFGVSPNTIQLLKQLFVETGDLAAETLPRGPRTCRLTRKRTVFTGALGGATRPESSRAV